MSAWEDVPLELGDTAEVYPSHDGGEYLHFIEIAQGSLGRYGRAIACC
jgi:hypothetical protein